MERGELPSRAVVRQLAGHALAVTAVVFALAGAGTFFVEYFGRHGFDSPMLPFGGWQVDLVLAGIALVGLALVAVGGAALRRFRKLPDTPRSYQVIASFVAVVVGIAGVRAFHHEAERVYNWASGYTGSAHRFEQDFARQNLRALGDATHPPMLRNPGTPATTAQSARLLVPSDLGHGWRYAGTPKDTVGHPTSRGSRYVARTFVTAEHWNGTLWSHDQDLIESVSVYTTAADARAAIRSDLHATEACSFPGSCTPGQHFMRSAIAGLTVWRESESDPHALNALILDGTTVTLVFCALPAGADALPRLTGDRILRAAIRRLELADRSK